MINVTREMGLLLGILVVDFLLLLFGIFGTVWFNWHQMRMLSLVTASIGIATFVGFFAVTYGPKVVIECAMRNSITASVIAMYLAIVGIVTFWDAEAKPLPKLTEMMVDSFQTVVTVVIAFYFTSSAVVEGIARTQARGGNVPGEENRG